MIDKEKLQLNRRKFVSSLGVIGAVVGLNPYSLLANSPQVGPQKEEGIFKCKPYLQALQTDRVTVRWITNIPCYSWVEYGKSMDNLNQKAQTIIDGLIQANNTINEIELQNLEPGKKYYYRIVSKRIDHFVAGKIFYDETAESRVYSFSTPSLNIENVNFLIFNDVHDRPETFAHMMKYQDKSKKDFVLLNGDIFSSLKGGEDQIVAHLLNPVSDLFATEIPFIFSRGNHEARGEYARQLPDYVNGQKKKFYYSKHLGPLYVIVLDSGEDKEDDHPAYGGILDFDAYRLEQKSWLEKEVKKKAFRDAKFKVVFNHIPPYYTPNKDAHGTSACRNLWVPILNKANIDLMISGHTHRYGIHLASAGLHTFPIVIGGGPENEWRTIINVNVTQQNLKLKIIDDKGTTVGVLDI